MGTRRAIKCLECIYWDHPHAYGDKCSLPPNNHPYSGSSPRVWGQESLHNLNFRSRRIIPTRMGTRKIAKEATDHGMDHPHAYGDKRCFGKEARRVRGSSPRVWGQAALIATYTVQRRIIPTRMGTSLLLLPCARVVKDHPHAYGDKCIFLLEKSVSVGSSPRVWGQVMQRAGNSLFTGIIPTRMGTSLLLSLFVSRR